MNNEFDIDDLIKRKTHTKAVLAETERLLTRIGLGGMQIKRPFPEKANWFYRDKKMVGLTSFTEIPLALAAGADIRRDKTSAGLVVVVPTETDSGLYVGRRMDGSSAFWTDSFLMFEDGIATYHRPVEPISLNMVDSSFGLPRNYPYKNPLWEGSTRLDTIMDDKQQTKEVLEKGGINVPNGRSFNWLNRHSVVLSFLRKNFLDGVVLKGVSGTGGKQVRPFEKIDTNLLLCEVDKLFRYNKKLIIEERIVPPDVDWPDLENTDTRFDYNYRILTTPDKNNPQVVGGYIRRGEFGDYPLSTSAGTPILKLEALRDPDRVSRLFRTTEDATRIVMNDKSVRNHTAGGLIGWDVIEDRGMNVYIIEGNPINPGGVQTLTRYDRSSQTRVRSVYLRRMERLIDQQPHRRDDYHPDIALPVNWDPGDLWELYWMFNTTGNIPAQISILQQMELISPNQQVVRNELEIKTTELNRPDVMEQFLKDRAERTQDRVITGLAEGFYGPI